MGEEGGVVYVCVVYVEQKVGHCLVAGALQLCCVFRRNPFSILGWLMQQVQWIFIGKRNRKAEKCSQNVILGGVCSHL